MKHDADLRRAIDLILKLPDEERLYVLTRLTMPQRRTLFRFWAYWAHDGQQPPNGAWRTWLLMAGRGFGKTRAGAEWVTELARENGALRIALVGATLQEVERVMIRGTSGLMAVAREDEDLLWYSSRGLLQFASGAEAQVYSGANPDALRGPQHHLAWCDELAKWAHPEATFDNLLMGLRAGDGARVLITTTPRPVPLLRRLLAERDATVVTRGRTTDNGFLPEDFVTEMTARYGGTRLGRQELDGELIEEVEGALWTRALIEQRRARASPALARVAVGVDPPASAGGDACGIVACGLGEDGCVYVLGDHSVAGLAPEGWARAVVAAAEAWGAERVVAETNQGGEMVASVLRGVDATLPVKGVRARFGKAQRAEPVSAWCEGGKLLFAGAFPELEDELCGLISGGGYEGPGRSPDRADAMVWAATELMPRKVGGVRVRGL